MQKSAEKPLGDFCVQCKRVDTTPGQDKDSKFYSAYMPWGKVSSILVI